LKVGWTVAMACEKRVALRAMKLALQAILLRLALQSAMMALQLKKMVDAMSEQGKASVIV
jgi:hypothetical protein